VSTAVAADAGEIWTVQRAAFVGVAQLYGDVRLPPLTETLAELTAAVEEGRVLVARFDGGPARIVGAVRTRVSDGVCHIGRLVVAPDLHGHGIGSALLRAAEERHAPGVREYALFTGVGSGGSVALYVRHGYAVERVEPDPGHPDLVHLRKPA
jgi:GNAT superfamily N-acetyltransferase